MGNPLTLFQRNNFTQMKKLHVVKWIILDELDVCVHKKRLLRKGMIYTSVIIEERYT